MRGIEHVRGILPCKTYGTIVKNKVGGTSNADMESTVKYQAFLRKATRYNPTRGGKHIFLDPPVPHIPNPIDHQDPSTSAPHRKYSTAPCEA